MKQKLFNQKGILSLFYSICFLLLGANLSWGQQVIGSFPYMDGGFEGQTATTTLTSSVSTTAWTVSATLSSTTRSIINDATAARTGNKYANHVTSAANIRLQSPSTATAGAGPAVNTQYTVQYYFKTTTDPTTGLNAGGIYNDASNSKMAASTIVGAWSSGTWTKAYSTITSNATQVTPYAATGFGAARTAIASNNLYDDFVIYPGAYDSTSPSAVTAPTASIASATTFNIGWTASADSDKSGYMVVRYAANPSSNAAAIPNSNGIYAVGNTILNGSSTGTVVYISSTTTTSFTNIVADTGVVYYYRIFTVDKAFNYSSPVDIATVVDNTPPPSAGTVSIGGITASSLAVSWGAATSVDGGGYMVVRYTSSPNADNDPTQKTTYVAANTYTNGTGSLTGTVIYVGTGLTVTDTGLSELTTYYYKVYTFDQAKNYANESSANGATISSVVVDNTPPNNPGAVTISNQTASTLTTSWVAAVGGVDGGGYLVLRFSGAPDADADPVQKTAYNTGDNILNLGSTNPKTAKVAYVGTNLTFVNTALSEANNYYFKVYTFDQAYNYSGESTITGRTASQIVTPVATAADTPTASSFNANWESVTNATGYTVSLYTSTNTTSTIVGWTIPTALADATSLTADITTTNNTSKTLYQYSSGTIVTTAQTGNPSTGFAARGATYYSTSGTAPNQVVLAAPVKYWQVEVNTVGYKNATISSDQISSATGPKDFKLQYSSTGPSGVFTDLVSTITLNSSTWTSVTNVALPASCQNNPNVVLRWAQTSFLNVASVEMTTTSGTNKIDNILVKGEKLDAVNTFSVTGNTTTAASLTGLTGGTYYYDVYATGTNTTSGSGVLTSYLTSQKSNMITYWLAIPESIADYKSTSSGNLSDFTIWQYFDGTTWNNATVPPTSTNNVTVTTGNEITLTANFGIGSTKTMTVNGTLNLAGFKVTGSGGFTLSAGATIKLGNNTSLATGITATPTFSTAANYFYDGTVAQNTSSLPTASITGNVIISNNTGGVVLAAALRINTPGTLSVTGKLLMGDGNVVNGSIIGSGTFNYNGSGNFSAATGSTLGITSSKGICKLADNSGNIRNSGTRTFANGINYIFAKNDLANPINMGTSFGNEISASLGINNLTINNPLGVYLPGAIQAVNAGGVTVTDYIPDTDITVNGVLNFISGKLIANNGANFTSTVDAVTTYNSIPQSTGTKTVTIGASGSITGSASNTGWVIGNLKKLTNSGASPSYTYAIGDANYYTPLQVTFSGNTNATGGLTARTNADDHAQIATSDIIAAKSINRNWTLTNDGLAGFTNYDATFNYVTQDNDSNVVTQFFAARLFNGASWSNLTTSGTPSSTSFTASSVSGFGDFAIGQVCINPISGGTISGTQSFCGIATPADLLSTTAADGYLGVLEYQWQSSTDNNTFSNITDATASSYSPPAGLSVTTYYRRLARVDCKSNWTGAASSNVITVTVNNYVTPAFTQVAPICFGTTLSALPTTSNNGVTGSWSPSVNSAATTLYTFTPTEGSCADTATMTIAVNQSVAGIISGNQTITTGTTPTNITLSNYTGNIQWQSSTNGTSFSNINGATSATLSGTTIGALTVNTYIRAVVTNGSCASANSAVSAITITCCKFKFSSN